MTTAGDRGASPEASPSGTKGLFVEEIAEAVLSGDIDLAVHSAKDLPSEDPPGLVVAAVPERGLPYDVLITREGELGEGAVVGTSSLRRQAQLLRMRPGAAVRDLRGNVDTRLRRLEEGAVDGVILAAAGLVRLGIEPSNALPLPMDEMVPAPGQGALAVQAAAHATAAEAARELDHGPSRTAFDAERTLVSLVGGGCRLPLGAYAESRGAAVRLLAVVIQLDGSDLVWAQIEGERADEVAREAAEVLRAGGAEEILEAVRG